MKASCWYGSALFGFALIASLSTSIACGKSSCCISKPATRAASCDWPGSTLSTLRYASSARSISPFSSNAIPSTKCASASALCAPPARKARSPAGLGLSESSWRPVFFIAADEDPIFGDDVLGGRLAASPVAKRKSSAKKRPLRRQMPQFLFRCVTLLMLVFVCDLSSRGRGSDRGAHRVVDHPFY